MAQGEKLTRLRLENHHAAGYTQLERPLTQPGQDVAKIWSDLLGRPVVYGGDDPSGFEQNMASFMPKWTAYEMRLMAERYVSDGMIPETGDIERLTSILGRPLHSYRDFAAAIANAA